MAARSASTGDQSGHPLFSIFDRPFDFPACFAGFDGLAAVVELLAFGESQLDLGMTALGEIDAEGDEGEALLLGLAEQLVDLFLMQQQLADPERVVVHDVAVAVGTDMAVVEK